MLLLESHEAFVWRRIIETTDRIKAVWPSLVHSTNECSRAVAQAVPPLLELWQETQKNKAISPGNREK
jgi:hypothetical protein